MIINKEIPCVCRLPVKKSHKTVIRLCMVICRRFGVKRQIQTEAEAAVVMNTACREHEYSPGNCGIDTGNDLS